MSFVNISCDQLFAILLFGGQELGWLGHRLTFQIDRLVIEVNDSQCAFARIALNDFVS